jgi:hypothetical protein
LQLLKTMKIYPVFHISLFEPVSDNILIDFQQKAETDYDEYEVEEILDLRQKGRTVEYLIKWKDSLQTFADFHRQHPEKQ